MCGALASRWWSWQRVSSPTGTAAQTSRCSLRCWTTTPRHCPSTSTSHRTSETLSKTGQLLHFDHLALKTAITMLYLDYFVVNGIVFLMNDLVALPLNKEFEFKFGACLVWWRTTDSALNTGGCWTTPSSSSMRRRKSTWLPGLQVPCQVVNDLYWFSLEAHIVMLLEYLVS